MSFALHTPRLTLRPARMEDLATVHAILSDDLGTAFWSTPAHRSLAETSCWLAEMMRISPELGEDFIIEHEGAVIGKAGFYRFPEIGFILHPDCWRKGFAREALRAVLARAFEVHGLAAVVADVDPRNAASLGLLAKLGFVETGRSRARWHIGGRWCDSVDLRLDRARFVA